MRKQQATRNEDLPMYPWWVEALSIFGFLALVAWISWAAAHSALSGVVMACTAVPVIAVLLLVLAVHLLKDEE